MIGRALFAENTVFLPKTAEEHRYLNIATAILAAPDRDVRCVGGVAVEVLCICKYDSDFRQVTKPQSKGFTQKAGQRRNPREELL